MSSLKDLAQECGVSVATVSKALNGQSDISEATRTRVREAARRMGYVPNMAARSMKTNRTYNIGVLFVDERQSGLAHEYFSAVLDSFKVRVEQLGNVEHALQILISHVVILAKGAPAWRSGRGGMAVVIRRRSRSRSSRRGARR